jgi:hypothetical protein
MQDDPPNAYIELSLRDLGDAIGRRARALLSGESVSRRDIAYLLIAASRVVAPHDPSPDPPPRRVARGHNALEAYRPFYESRARDARYQTISQAIEAAGLHGAPRGLHGELDHLRNLAVRNDAGLYEALKRLETLRSPKAPTSSDGASMLGA